MPLTPEAARSPSDYGLARQQPLVGGSLELFGQCEHPGNGGQAGARAREEGLAEYRSTSHSVGIAMPQLVGHVLLVLAVQPAAHVHPCDEVPEVEPPGDVPE